VEGAEHRVRPSILRPHGRQVVDGRDAGVEQELALERSCDGALAPACERADVRARVHLVHAGLPLELRELPLRRPMPDHEAAATRAQRLVQVLQALEQELRTRAGGMPAVEEAIIEAEDR
jgi:hypothetical protein